MAGNAAKIGILLTHVHFLIILWTIVYENQTVFAPSIVSKLSYKLIDHAIVSFLYFFSTQIRIAFIIFLGMNDFACHLGKLKLVGFKGFVIWMSLHLAS